MTPHDAFNQLSFYTMAHAGAQFIHQHAVDAFGAQEVTEAGKPVRLIFSLVGLYLHVEKGWTGREVQLAHMKLAREKHAWPPIVVPPMRGAIDVLTVLAAPTGDRDAMIHRWCRSVWGAYSDQRAVIETLLRTHKITDPRSVQTPTQNG